MEPGQYGGTNLGTPEAAADARACQKLCFALANPSCVAWTFDSGTGSCTLKSSVPAGVPASPREGYTSGPRLCNEGSVNTGLSYHAQGSSGIDRCTDNATEWTNALDAATTEPSRMACKLRCRNTPGCNSISYGRADSNKPNLCVLCTTYISDVGLNSDPDFHAWFKQKPAGTTAQYCTDSDENDPSWTEALADHTIEASAEDCFTRCLNNPDCQRYVYGKNAHANKCVLCRTQNVAVMTSFAGSWDGRAIDHFDGPTQV